MRRLRRRRGATFTMVALVTSTLLMVSAGVFLRSTGQTMGYVGLETRRTRAREAAFAGVAWAARDAAANQAAARREGRGALELDRGVTVEVVYRPLGADSPDLLVTVTVSPLSGDAPFTLTGTLAPSDDGYALVRFD